MYFQNYLVLSTLLGQTFARRNNGGATRKRLRALPYLNQTSAAIGSPSEGDSNFTCYSGNGANWPQTSQWLSFDSMWSGLVDAGLGQNCDSMDGPITPNSEQETAEVRAAIENIASQSKVDDRFILAIIMNESSGCVRVRTTHPPQYPTIYNPGLMQDHSGHSTCNCAVTQYGQTCGGAEQQVPCPQCMISDGTVGTAAGDGLETLLQNAQNGGAQDAQAYYIAAATYNQGSNIALDELPGYSIKVANWLTGWTSGNYQSCSGEQ